MKLLSSRFEFLSEIKYQINENPVCIEIGVAAGIFSRDIINTISPKKLYLVDPWQIGYDKNSDETYGDVLSYLPTAYSTEEQYKNILCDFYNEIKNNQVIVRPDFSYNVVDDLPDNYFDFIYIDSCHLYNSVKADLNMFLPKLKSNGLMCGHDYFNFDNFGVIQAVDEFCEEQKFEMIYLVNDSWDWALKRRS